MLVDMHMHVIPGVDDGATDMAMSLEMLEFAYAQGVRDVFCTSHNVYSKGEIERYKARFMTLSMMVRSRCPDLNLHMGCELLCAGEYMDDIPYGLEIGVFLPLGGSRFVLTELYPDATPEEAKMVVKAMLDAGWKPVLAHTERYPNLFDGHTIRELAELGASIQVNLSSLDACDDGFRQRSRYLIDNQLAHFVGSDAHRLTRRAPMYQNGVSYIEAHCTRDYADAICYKNALELILGKNSKA